MAAITQTDEIFEAEYFLGDAYDNSASLKTRGKGAIFLSTGDEMESSDDEPDAADDDFIDTSDIAYEFPAIKLSGDTIQSCRRLAASITRIVAECTAPQATPSSIIMSTAMPDVRAPLRWPKNPRAALRQFTVQPLGRGHRDRTRRSARKVKKAIAVQVRLRKAYLRRQAAN